MPPILIKQPNAQSKEELLRVNLAGTAGGEGGPDLVVVSGYALYNHDVIAGSEDTDMLSVSYIVEMLVGPIWLRLADVSPTVTVAGYESQEADEADMMAFRVTSCRWEFPEPPEPRRIRLIVSLSIGGGEQASITSLAYHLVARGMLAPGQDFHENN
jgi:hypothetical protein